MRQNDSLFSLLARIRRRWVSFTLVFLATIAAAIGGYLVLTPKYTAHAAIVVQRVDVVATGTAPAFMPSSTVGDPSDIESQIDIVRSPRLIRMMLDRPDVLEALERACAYDRAQVLSRLKARLRQLFGLTQPSCSETSAADTIDGIRRGIGASESGRSRVIDVSYSASLPESAAAVVNALVEVYLSDNASAKSDSRWHTANWLEEEIASLRSNLEKKETEIDQYEQTHNLLQGQTALVTREQLTSLITQLGDAQSRLARANAQLQEIREAKRSGTLAAMPAVVNSPTIKNLRDREAQVDARIGDLTSQFGPLYPAVQRAQAERLKIVNAITAEVDRTATSLNREIADTSGQVQQLQSYYLRAKQEASKANDANSRLQSLLRDADVDRQLYSSLAIHAKELETETRAESPDARLVNLSELPYRPSFPRPLSFFAASLVLAGTLGGVFAALRDRGDRTVHVAADIVPYEGEVRVLGRVPYDRRLRRPGVDFRSAISRETSPVREAMRSLYARLSLGPKAKTLLITSSIPKEGKSSLAVALAHYAASAQQRVLLIEADMRKPMIGRLLGLPGGEYGLYHLLSGKATLGEAIERLPVFDLMRAGAVAANSTELLSTEVMRDVLAAATARYDLVIIDTPPCEYLMDARMVARHVDGIIYSVCWGFSRPDVVRSGLRALAGAGVLGVVLNMVEPRRYRTYDPSSPFPARAYIEGTS